MYTISYDPLWKTLVDKHWNKAKLQKETKLSSATIAKLTNGESVTMDVIGRICEALECPVYDVVDVTTSSSASLHQNLQSPAHQHSTDGEESDGEQMTGKEEAEKID